MSHERLGHGEQRVDARLVHDGDENRPLRDVPDTCVCRRCDIQRRILPKNRPLELVECRARFDPELVDECTARVLVGVQGLRLSPRPVQRRHQTSPQAFAERVLGDQCLELSDQLVVASEREVCVDPQLDCRQPDLLEPGDGSLGEALVGEVRERGAPPQRQRVA